MKAYQRLLTYVAIPTASSPTAMTHPSSDKQWVLARRLTEELAALGAQNIRLSEQGYVYADIAPTEGCESAPKLGFIAHMDTSPDAADAPVHAQIIENYNGLDVPLGESGRVLSVAMFPHLKTLTGRTLITTDGHTLLGADDKAGIAEILTMIERLRDEDIAHGALRIAFTPDEEIGEGADHFDVEGFDADFAYTVDGGVEGSIEYENFNAASAVFTVHGIGVHPGSAKDTMRNASLVAMQINALLPAMDTPAHTQGYEGFYHLTNMQGTVEKATLSYIIRDHDAARFAMRKATLHRIAAQIDRLFGEGTVQLTVTDSYRNMSEKILPHSHLIEHAKRAAQEAGVTPIIEPIRGGTDGARLSFMGLPCPNLGTGGYAFHGPFEHITAEGMDIATNILLGIVSLYAKAK